MANEKKEVKMIPAEQADAQMQKVITQAQSRVHQLTMQCNQLEAMLRDRTIEQMFKVIEYSHLFSEGFPEKCAAAIEKYIANVAFEALKEENLPESSTAEAGADKQQEAAPAETKAEE